MTRIFGTLAAANFVALVAAYLVGWLSRSQAAVLDPDNPTCWVHFHVGLYTALLTLFVHSLIFVYFLGTGRWVKEVAIAYDLPDVPYPKLTRELKRQAFPPALFAMLIVIATAAAGAGAQTQVWPWGVHATVATLALLVNAWAYRIEYRCLSANIVALDEVTAEIDRVRASRGLPSNAEALEQQNT
jgi:hypothetical protein